MLKTNTPLPKSQGDPVPLRMGDGIAKARRASLSRYFVAPIPNDTEEGSSDEATVSGQMWMVDEGQQPDRVDQEADVYLEICVKDAKGRSIVIGSVGLPEGGSDLWSGWVVGDRETGSPLVVCSVVGSETFDD